MDAKQTYGMDQRFLKIAITSPEDVSREAEKIEMLLDSGIDYVHIRKPHASLRDIRNLIEDVPFRLRQRLKLHGHFELAYEFNLGGVHLNSRCPVPPSAAVSVSCSCHTLKEVEAGFSRGMEYVTLSPIFDSISKQGYTSAFNTAELIDKISGKNVIALGGVTPDKFPLLRNAGFAGAAMLGCIWNDFDNFISCLKHND